MKTMFNNIKTNFIVSRNFMGFRRKNGSFSSFIFTGHSGSVMLHLLTYLSKFTEDVSMSLASFESTLVK